MSNWQLFFVKNIDNTHKIRIIISVTNKCIFEVNMKRQILIKDLENAGYYLLRHGGGHDIYTNGELIIAVPRHREINEITAKQIRKEAGLK